METRQDRCSPRSQQLLQQMRLPPRRSQVRCALPRMRSRGEGVRRLPKLRKVCKWTGLVLSVMLLVVWVGSKWYRIGFSADRGQAAYAEAGAVEFWHNLPILGLKYSSSSWYTREASGPWRWWFQYITLPTGESLLVFPMWPLVLGVVGTTAVIWRRDRRLSKPGLCKQCGYDIRGLQKCPECGMKTV